MTTRAVIIEASASHRHDDSVKLVFRLADADRTPLLALRLNRWELQRALYDAEVHPPTVPAELVPAK